MSKPIIVKEDPWLEPYTEIIRSRYEAALNKKKKLSGEHAQLKDFAVGYLYYGMHKTENSWIFREYAPNATAIFIIGDFNSWQENDEFRFRKVNDFDWEFECPTNKIQHGQKYKLLIYWNGGKGFRLPAYARRCIQDEKTKIFDAQVWMPDLYQWQNPVLPHKLFSPVIYEAHIGMATEEQKVGSFGEFSKNVLPRIANAGYNTIQLMAIQEHPYYGSFGYHVSNFFAVSSRFGTPEDLKELIDTAHGMGIAVIMDLVHSHAVKNELEGLGNLDGDPGLYFHTGHRREHSAWDSLCFDYGKDHVMHFLLSNCRFWLDEYHFDGFRFDGVTSMLYYDHGLGRDFNHYDRYFDGGQDGDAIIYLTLANEVIHETNPNAITIAEDMSGMPGLAESFEKGGIGFDYRLSMGIPDYWIKLLKERPDDSWNMTELFHVLAGKRYHERTISYAESHDQALVGDKTVIFWLMDKEMYFFMDKESQSLIIDRGIALHKIIRLVTFGTSGGGYLNFIGNEFGHPEWIDFPREGNNWSYKYARRQWHLADDKNLRYHWLADFDRDMVALAAENSFMNNPQVNLILDNSSDKTLAFSRGDLLFVFNFHPTVSYTDYGIQCHPGRYNLILDTDEKKYGGFGNIDHSVAYFTQRVGGISGSNWLKLYLPPRIGLVFKKLPTHSVYDI